MSCVSVLATTTSCQLVDLGERVKLVEHVLGARLA
jgi:hypothetical protein